MNVSAVTSGTVVVGQYITGTGIALGTRILSNISGTGGIGTYTVSQSQSVSSTTLKLTTGVATSLLGGSGSSTPGGTNTQVQFNNSGSLDGASFLTYDQSNTSNVILTLSNGYFITNNANLGNSATANFFTGTLTTNAQPNITSVGTLTSLAVTAISRLGTYIQTQVQLVLVY